MPKRKKIFKTNEPANDGSSIKKPKNVNSTKSCRRMIRALKSYNRENECNLFTLINDNRNSSPPLKANNLDQAVTIHLNFDQIINKVNTNGYSRVEQLCDDIESIINDVKAAYKVEDKEYQDAFRLHEFFLDLKKDFCLEENTLVNSSSNNRQSEKPEDEINVVKVMCGSNEFIKSNNNDTSILISKNNVKSDRNTCLDDSNIIVLDQEEDEESESIALSLVTARSDEPWTVKYKPLNSAQVLDNKEASDSIRDWIYDFMNKSPTDSRLDYYDDDDDYEYDDRLESCAIIYGPTGCGKTAMVYALAEELNCKVFEINCSSRRNGKIINQIKETTLSHTVSRHSNSNSNSPCKIPPPTTPRKSTSKKNVIDPKQKSLFSFFQNVKPPPPLAPTVAAVQKVLFNSTIEDSSMSQETVNNLTSLTISSNSLILFDDVDIIFEEDTGFWQALSQLIQNTKRPIILTATSSIQNIKQEIKNPLCIEMNYPTQPALIKHLKDIVFKECYESVDSTIVQNSDCDNSPILEKHVKQIELISKDNHCDIRASMNRLQFDFSSVNITNHDQNSTRTIDQQNCSSINLNSVDEISLAAYNDLILCDQFSADPHFHINSRDKLNNACTYDETYKSKDLRLNVQYEFRRYNEDMYKLLDTCREDLKWSYNLKLCAEEINYRLKYRTMEQLYCDYLPYLLTIMESEQERLQLYIKHTRRARRFMHYLDNIQFNLSDSTKQFLEGNYFCHINQ